MKIDVEELKEKINKFVEGDSMRSTIAAQSQLSSATIKQKDIDYLLEVMLQTKANSEYGVKTATEVYENATKIYEALKSFISTYKNSYFQYFKFFFSFSRHLILLEKSRSI